MKNAGFIQKTIFSLIAILIVYVIFVAVVYSSISSKRQSVKSQFANIHATIERKADLMPQLSSFISQNTVSTQQKNKWLNETKDIQNTLANTNDPKKLYKLEQRLDSISKLMMEKINLNPNKELLIRYQAQIEGSENRINVARYQYNQAVDVYNSAISGFAGTMVNDSFLHYKKAIYYHSDKVTGFEATKNIFES